MMRQSRAGEQVDTRKSPGEEPALERRYIYGGDPQFSTPGYAIRPHKRRSHRKRPTFNIIVLLFGLAIAIVLYVSNIIAVNQLALDVHELEVAYDKVANVNASLKAEINRKSGWERIGNIASQELGLRYPKQPPAWLELDEGKYKEFGKK